MAAKKMDTWVGYMERLGSKKLLQHELQVHGIEKLINLQEHAFTLLNHSVPMIYLLDYTTGKYAFVSSQCQSVLNFSYQKLMEGGVNFTLDSLHAADLRLFNEQIFIDRQKFLKQTPVEQHKDHIFSYNYRYKNGEGKYVNILQRSSVIQSDEDGNPLVSFGALINIDHFKEENPVIQLVEKVDSITGRSQVVAKNTYYLHEENKIFSKREKEILLYLVDGLTGRQIADKLFISEHTVINHKRNMLHKSNTQNTVALIGFAFKQHLL